MIFVQQLFDNFLPHTHIILLFSLFLFFSSLFLTNEKRGKKKLSPKVVSNGCSNITTRKFTQMEKLGFKPVWAINFDIFVG